MAAQGKTVGTAFGSSLALTTNTGLNTATLIRIDKGWELMRKAVETTHSLSTGGYKTFVPGDIKEYGTMEFTLDYDTQVAYDTFFNAGCDTLTFTFVKRATTCTGSLAGTAGTIAMAVVFEKMSAAFPFEDRMAITVTFRISGAITFTPAQT